MIFLVTLLGSELAYYLLIIQTGIVEFYHSNLYLLWGIPLGGVIGTFTAHKKFFFLDSLKKKGVALLALQLLLSFSYPSLGGLSEFLLGFAVGSMAPVLLFLFRGEGLALLALGLGVSYATGTYFFNTPPIERESLAVILSTLALVSFLFIPQKEDEAAAITIDFSSILPLFLWLVLDFSLFEMLSRSDTIPIWREHYTPLIIAFHLTGLVFAYLLRDKGIEKGLILTLFIISYGAFYAGFPTTLAIFYPFVISFYNFFVFKALLKIPSLRTLSILMVFTCWVASGIGFGIAVLNTVHLPIVFIILLGIQFLKKGHHEKNIA